MRFLRFGEADPYTDLQPGTVGTVGFVDDSGTVHVNWDSGHTLGMVLGETHNPDVIVKL